MIKLLKYNNNIMMHYLLTYYEQNWEKMFPRGFENSESLKDENITESEKKYTTITAKFIKVLTDPNYFNDENDENEFISFISY